MYDKLIADLKEDAEWAEANEWETPICLSDHIKQAIEAIEQLQTNVVDVVRCKDCKHRPFSTEEGKNYGLALDAPDWVCPYMCEDGYYSRMPGDDWFCEKGERA